MLKGYQDGVLLNSTTPTGGNYNNGDDYNLTVGKPLYPNDSYRGYIDAVFYKNDSLSDNEIMDLYLNDYDSIVNYSTENVSIKIGDGRKNIETVGSYFNKTFTQNSFDDGTIFNMTFSAIGGNLKYITLPRYANVSIFSLIMNGYEYGKNFFDNLDNDSYISSSSTTEFVDGSIILNPIIGISQTNSVGFFGQCDYSSETESAIGQTFIAETNQITGIEIITRAIEHGDDKNFTIGIGTGFELQDLWNTTINTRDFIVFPSDAQWYSFYFDKIAVTKGQTYYLSFKPEGNSCYNSDTFAMQGSNNVYPNGSYYRYDTFQQDWDLAFKIYDKYDSSSIVYSNTLYNPIGDITEGTFNASYNEPAGTSIEWWTSADGGINWEDTILDSLHNYINTGTNLKWKARLNTTNPNITSEIYDITFNISKNYPNNITIDVGQDGNYDYYGIEKINESTPINIIYTEFYTYLNSLECSSNLCQVPVAIGSSTSGILQISNVTLNYTIPFSVDGTVIQAYLDNDTLCLNTLNISQTNIDAYTRDITFYNNSHYTISSTGNIKVAGLNGSLISTFTLTGGDYLISDGIDIFNDTIYVTQGYNPVRVQWFNMSGNYKGEFNTTQINWGPFGITTNGTYIWVGDSWNGKLWKYNMSGSYTGISVNKQTGTAHSSITTDGIYIYEIAQGSLSNSNLFYVYDFNNGSYITSVNSGYYTIQGLTNTVGISTDKDNFLYLLVATTGNPLIIKVDKLLSEYDKKCNIPITLYSDTAGNLTIDTLNLSYYGYQNLTVTAESLGSSISRYLYAIYSNYNYSLPHPITMPFYVPLTNESKNVTPIGQTLTKPIFNISSLAYKLPFDFYLFKNETFNCVNEYATNDSSYLYNTSYGTLLTTTMQKLGEIDLFKDMGIWLWSDFNCSRTQRYLSMKYKMDTLCIEDCL